MDRRTSGRPLSREEFLRAIALGAALIGCDGVGAACDSETSLELTVRPERLEADEPFLARVEGLFPGERTVLSASFVDDALQEWSSTAVFEADERGGVVDTSEHAPVRGSYGLRDPMGLVWAALGADFYVPPVGASFVTLSARAGDRDASAKVERHAAADGVRISEVRERGLVGRLFLPEASAGRPVPGVLVLGGSEGGLGAYVAYEAALLASHGFAALALAYFGGDRTGEDVPPGALPETLARIPLEYFGEALGWLGGRKEVDPDRLGVLGHSRGGELALLLGATYPELKVVISCAGSGLAGPSLADDGPAWTLRGEPVPHLAREAYGSRPGEEELSKAAIPVERTRGPVLLISGDDDALWPSDLLSRAAYDRLRRHGHPHADELAVCPGAGHLIQAPYAPTAPGRAHFGGSAEANARACEGFWKKAISLLQRRLEEGSRPATA